MLLNLQILRKELLRLIKIKIMEILQEKIGSCSFQFDKYNGEQIFYKLKLHYIEPEKGPRSVFSGMFPRGNQWAVEFFTQNNKYNHPGGWCWSQNPDLWANKVNEDLFEKRIDEQKEKFYISSYKKSTKNPPVLEVPPYIHLINGEDAKIGDIIKMSVTREYYRAESFDLYILFCWTQQYGGIFNCQHWNFGFYHQDIRTGWQNEDHLNIDLGEIISRGEILEHKKSNIDEIRLAYGRWPDYARKIYRNIKNIKGSPKWDELLTS